MATYNKGKSFEREIISKLRPFYPKAVSTRSANRRLDSAKVDICNEDASKLDINYQCKNMKGKINYLSILHDMPKSDYNMVIHKMTRKSDKGMFLLIDIYCCMEKKQFEECFNIPNGTNITRVYGKTLPDPKKYLKKKSISDVIIYDYKGETCVYLFTFNMLLLMLNGNKLL